MGIHPARPHLTEYQSDLSAFEPEGSLNNEKLQTHSFDSSLSFIPAAGQILAARHLDERANSKSLPYQQRWGG